MRNKNKNNLVLSWLRNNARISLTSLSKKTNVPISTLYDHIRCFEQEGLYKFVTIVDFAKFGFGTKAQILIKCKNKKSEICKYLSNYLNVNNLSRVNNGFDFIVEAIFPNMQELELFLEGLGKKFKIKYELFYIIEELKKENFLTVPELTSIM